MQSVRAALLAILCAGAAGCAAPKPPPPKPIVQADPIDGEYLGTSTRYQADSRGCPHPGSVSLVVWDNKFQYHWNREIWLDAAIADDGMITGSGPGLSLQGRVDGKRLEGDVTNGTCGFHFTVTKHGS